MTSHMQLKTNKHLKVNYIHNTITTDHVESSVLTDMSFGKSN